MITKKINLKKNPKKNFDFAPMQSVIFSKKRHPVETVVGQNFKIHPAQTLNLALLNKKD